VGRFSLKKLSELELTTQYQTEIWNSSADLETFNDSEDVHRAWENITDNVTGSRLNCRGCTIQTKVI
jgi:hypothetical protein